MESLSLTLIQKDIYWESPERNFKAVSNMLETLKFSSDIIILPEMFNTGFTKNTSLAEDFNGITMNYLSNEANKNNAVIASTIPIKYNNALYNMFIWMKPDGTYDFFPKKHLFSIGDEHTVYKAGKDKVVFECKGWKILPLICYDLRFPVWSKNIVKNNEFLYDLIIYTANWPSSRHSHWEDLLKARAIENLSYVAACNRTGTDVHNVSYKGSSMIIAPDGKILANAGETLQKAVHFSLSKTELASYRNSFPVWKDWDKFEIL